MTATLFFADSVVHPSPAADAAAEARTINQHVLAFIKAFKLSEAETLAKMGLRLCDDVGDNKVFCASQFNESLGDIAFLQTKYSSALEYQEQALRLREAELDSGHLLVSRSLQRIGSVYLALKRMSEAETFTKRAVSGFEKLVPVNRELGISLGYLRKIYLDTDRIDDAITVARRELEVQQAIGDGRAIFQSRLNLASILSRLARSLTNERNYSAAEPILVEAIGLVDPPLLEADRTFSVLQAQIGYVYERQRRYAEAEPFMLRALEYRSKFAGPADSEIPIMLSNLASLYSNLRKPADTLTYGLRAISWFDENKKEAPNLGFDLLYVGRAQLELGHLQDGEATLVRARDVFDRVLLKNDWQRVNVRGELGFFLAGQERYGEAEQVYRSALAIEPELTRPATGWRSLLLARLGSVYRDQARYADAERLLREAVELDEADGQIQVRSLGQRLIELASILRRENRYAETEAILLRALALELPESDRASALNSLGLVYSANGRNETAETVLKDALAIRTRILPANSYLVVETIANLATVDESKGQYAEAEVKFRHVLQVVDALGLSQSSNAALYSAFLAHNLVSQGKLDEADPLIRRSLDLYEKRLGTDHPRYAGALKTRASIEALRGQDQDAEKHYRQALTIDERVVGPQSSAVADDLMNLVPLLKRSGKRQLANANIERALAIRVAEFGAESPVTTGAILASAQMAYETGQYDEARRLVDRALQIQERGFGSKHHTMVAGWIFMSRLDIAQGKLDDAAGSMARAAEILATALPPDNPFSIDVLTGNADVAQARGQLADAERHIRDALKLAQRLFEPDHAVRRNATDRLAGQLWVQGGFAEAERLQRDALAAVELRRGPDHPSMAVAMRGVAGILGRSGRQGEAILLFRRALAIDERWFGLESTQAAWDHLALGSLQRRMAQFEDARIEINLARNTWERQDRLLAANSSLEELAVLALDQGSPAEAVIFEERMLGTLEQAFGPESPALATSLAQLGRSYMIAGRTEAAERVLARIGSLIGNDPAEHTPGFLGVLQLRALLNAERGNIKDAEAGFVRAIAIAAKYGGVQGDAVGAYSFNLAALYLKAGRFREAIDNFLKALEIFKRESGNNASVVGYALLGAAQAYKEIGDQAASKALFATASEILGPTIAAQRPKPNWL